MDECFVCVYICIPCVYLVLKEARKGVKYHGTGGTGSCEHQMEAVNQTLAAEDTSAHSAEPSLQTLNK